MTGREWEDIDGEIVKFVTGTCKHSPHLASEGLGPIHCNNCLQEYTRRVMAHGVRRAALSLRVFSHGIVHYAADGLGELAARVEQGEIDV